MAHVAEEGVRVTALRSSWGGYLDLQLWALIPRSGAKRGDAVARWASSRCANSMSIALPAMDSRLVEGSCIAEPSPREL